jgi:hypothetical protein
MRSLPAQLKFNIAACAAVDLSFWADHPGAARRGRYVWALDDQRTAHIVHICGDATFHGTAEHVCERAALRRDGKQSHWHAKPFIDTHGHSHTVGYCTTRGIKHSFMGTHVPACAGAIDATPVHFDV